jgi:hypothetical protein
MTYEQVLVRDPSDIATALLLSQMLVNGLTIDTATPVDTSALQRAGEYLDLITSQSQDTSVLMNAAVLYYQPAQQLVQTRQALPIAVTFLEKALAADVLGRLTLQGNFFLGLGLMFEIFTFDQQVVDSQDCVLVAQEADMIRRGKAALEIGASISEQTATQFLGQYASFEQRIPQLREAFECGG